MSSIMGRIHSTESCGTVDGPGIRFVVFMQGCLMRCKYCHNRDTWDTRTGKWVTPQEIFDDAVRYRHFMESSGGGVTASGGEAILQAPFVAELFRLCQEAGIHTCLDTNGFMRQHTADIDKLLDVTGLVMLDIKHMDDDKHHDLTKVSNKHVLEFAELLTQRQQKTWIRHVVVGGYTDNPESAHLLGQYLQGRENIEKVELLPYHELGKYKWAAMGNAYELEGVHPPSQAILQEIQSILAGYGVKATF